MDLTYFYLHGFASSPYSSKAQYLQKKLSEKSIVLKIPDLNQNDFSNLTLTRQIDQVSQQLPNKPVVMMGSSFGGLTAAWLGEKYPQIQQLILLAPAFGFVSRWQELLGESAMKEWQENGSRLVYHYSQKQDLPIHYRLIADMNQYQECHLQKSIPTLILHGQKDEVIPIELSREYASQRPWVKLIELDSDHALTDSLSRIWQEITLFLNYKL